MLTSLGGDLKLRSTEDFDGRKSVGIDSPIEHHLAIPGFESRPSFNKVGVFLWPGDVTVGQLEEGSGASATGCMGARGRRAAKFFVAGTAS